MLKVSLVIVGVVVLSAFGLAQEALSLGAEDIVAIWAFDEGAGDVTKDVSGNDWDGTIVGAQWADGKYGKALEFDGVDNRVEILGSEGLCGFSQLTVALWANITGTGGTGFPRFVGKGKYESWLLMMYADPANLNFLTGSGGEFRDTTDLVPLFNAFHHYAATWDGQEVIFYIDGEETSKGEAGGDPVVDTEHIVRIGSGRDFSRSFQGVMDDLAVFTVALSADEIKQVMGGAGAFVSSTTGVAPSTWGAIKVLLR
jgi:hypothetical protein